MKAILFRLFVPFAVIVFLTGCTHKTSPANNIYKLDIDAPVGNYIHLSNDGIDYCFPDLKDRSWSEWKVYDDECMEISNEHEKIYVLRNIENEYSNEMDFDELKKSLINKISEYLGCKLDIEKTKDNIVDDIRYYDAIGKTSTEGKEMLFYGIFFQSYRELESVSSSMVPTVILVVYDSENQNENIKEMINDIKENMIRLE